MESSIRKPRVVITGMGAITPLGNTVSAFREGIKGSRCGIGPISVFDTAGYKATLAAQVKDFDPSAHMEKREAKRLDRFSQFAIVAAKEAMADSGLQMDELDPYRIGCIIGSGIGGLATIQQESEKLYTKGPDRVSPLFIPMSICNMAAGNVTIALGTKGISYSINTACASGTNAIGEGMRLIQRGDQDVVFVGGTEAAITPMGVSGFMNMTAITTAQDPARASIPFDKERSGFVMGEGAGVLVLEDLEHAQKRGATIYAEVVGYGFASDAYHITSPEPEGLGGAKAMESAVRDAGITPEQVDYINAHGTSTPYNDKIETKAIKDVFGQHSYKIPVNSTKSMIGHLLGAAGAVEAMAVVFALQDGYIHPTLGLSETDPDCDLDYVRDSGRQMAVTYALSNSLGFGGHNASILLKKWEG